MRVTHLAKCFTCIVSLTQLPSFFTKEESKAILLLNSSSTAAHTGTAPWRAFWKFAVALIGYHNDKRKGAGHWLLVESGQGWRSPHAQEFAAHWWLVPHMAFIRQTGHLDHLKCASNYIRTLILFYIQAQNSFAPFKCTLLWNKCKKRVWRLCWKWMIKIHKSLRVSKLET